MKRGCSGVRFRKTFFGEKKKTALSIQYSISSPTFHNIFSEIFIAADAIATRMHA